VDLLERDEALAALAAAHEAASGGQGRVVYISGEPGIGKTSLVTRFVRSLDSGSRVLVGACDDLTVPRPLGPLRDLGSPTLAHALEEGLAPHDIQPLLVAELERPPHPTVLVLEDVHWADDATLDVITVLGRRIGALPAVVVLTFRGGEVEPALRAVLGGIPAAHTIVLELAPLTEAAVTRLAGDEAGAVYAATGGNPFYVTELLASRAHDAPPPSVANAVLGRAARLDDDARRLVELVSVVPGRVATWVLDAVLPEWPAAAEEPERRQLLEVEPTQVRFRHELARNAIKANIPFAARRRLSGEILETLLAAGADPADIAHHAEEAGNEDVAAEYALVAARRAAALESNREAYSHYRRAAGLVDRLEPLARAAVLEEHAGAAYAVGELDDAFGAIERAIALYRRLGARAADGRCTRALSRFHWYVGAGAPARRFAREAIAILEPLGESVELAAAFSALSQLAMLAEDADEALLWGNRALELATRLGDERTRAHALVNIGTVLVQLDQRETAALLEAHAVADAAGDGHEATRALINLGYSLMRWVQPEPARRASEQALAYAEEHEVDTLAGYIRTMLAWLRIRAGDWGEPERIVRRETERTATVAELFAKTVLAEVAVRRGDAEAAALLDDLLVQADRADELQRIAPVLELVTERALTSGAPFPSARYEELVGTIARDGGPSGWGAACILAWAAVAGVAADYDRPMPAAYAAMLDRDWAAAAAAFAEVGWQYDRALMLSLLDEEAALDEALEIARRLGAAPLERRTTRRLRELGLHVPARPRASTRANPAGLTERQVEVLSFLSAGLTNMEIAERLVVSPRTVEHHVAAVLAKLGAATRRDAARRAAELGLEARR
jgi:predicted ATPase/DNA-binding CsgD family transcriptional regulator